MGADKNATDYIAQLLPINATLNKKMNTRWFLNLGASDHMANNREHFVDSVPTEPHDIQMGDNLPIQAVGIGTIYTVIPSNGYFAKMEPRNVLHVPRLCKNLVSWLCLHRNGA